MSAGAAAKILIGDDSATVREVAARVLEKRGFQVATASSAEEGLSMIEADAPSLVIMDLALPRMNGAQALKEIRSRWPHILVIVLTGEPAGDLRNEAGKYSPQAILSKPFAADELVGSVRKALGQEAPGSHAHEDNRR
jgi:two-component system C4-dicarboxylate transport response regulator DctD